MEEFYIGNMAGQLSFIEGLINKTERSLDGAPDGSLNIKHAKGYTQYYQYFHDGSYRQHYLGKKDAELLKALAQKDYDTVLLKMLKEKKKAIEHCQEHYPEKSIDSVYESLGEERMRLVNPIRLTDAQFLKEWTEAPFQGLGFDHDDTSGYYTAKGDRVRSKSEVIIADTLLKMGLPYRYECPLKLGNVTMHPDFTILDMRTREEKYLEHFGMMDKADYVDIFIRKMRLYETNGIIQGKHLIMTFESGTRPLDTRQLKNVLISSFR